MPKTLLLADDSVVIQKLVALSFANEDIDLVTVYNGDDAVVKAQECRPDLVLADVVMPGKSGYEVCEAIKGDPQLQHVPVLLLTGTFEAFDEERAQRSGADGRITKPFEAQALVDRINGILAEADSSEASPSQEAQEAPPAQPARAEDGAYDFFDDELSEPMSSGPSSPPATPDPFEVPPSDQAFSFGDASDPALEPMSELEHLSSLDDPVAMGDTRPESGIDRTVAILPGDSAGSGDAADLLAAMRDPSRAVGNAVPDAPTVTAAGFDAPVELAPAFELDSFDDQITEPAPEVEPLEDSPLALADDLDSDLLTGAPSSSPEEAELGPDPAATILTDGSFEEDPTGAPVWSAGDPEATVLSDGPGFGWAPAAGALDQPAETMLADDLFAEAAEPPTAAVETEVGEEEDLAFSFDGPLTPPALEMPPELDLTEESDLSAPVPEAELDPAGSSAYDVSSSDLGDPFSAPPEQETPAITAPIEEPAPAESPVAPELADPFAAEPIPVMSAPSESEPMAMASRAPDLSEVMTERVHETLEKVAWEAFADLSDTIVRQVLERVEAVAWEAIPQMAEALIREEIRKMKGESES
jgi:CheY-like chemotaxis protein